MMILYDKKYFNILACCLIFFVSAAIFFSFRAQDESIWFSRWFSDKFYVLIICSIYLLGVAIIDTYFNYFTFNRIGDRKKYLLCQLADQYLFAFILTNIIFVCIILGSVLKFNEIRTAILDILSWYFRYLLGLILVTNLCVLFQKSRINILAKFSYLWTFLTISFELIAIVPKLKILYGIHIRIAFSWIFYQNAPVSYIVLSAMNALVIIYLILVDSRRDLFI